MLDTDTIVGLALVAASLIALAWTRYADLADARTSRPLMPGVLCECTHVAAAHFQGEYPCVTIGCECAGFTAATRTVVAS